MPLRPFALGFVLLGLLLPGAGAAPYLPTDDRQVLERLPARATDPREREMRSLREQLARNPRDVGIAVQLVRRYYDAVAAEGDPRYIGYAQAALTPWWEQPDPPAAVRVQRAVLRQFSHQFDAALADLEAATRANPADGEARSWQAAILMVQARYPEARRACEALRPLASPLIGTACTAHVDSLSGHAAAAAAALRVALRAHAAAPAPERLWALTRLAEIEERRDDHAAAEATLRAALALDITDGYLLALSADFLLDRGRPAEVLALLKGKERSDLLLLRLALAAKTIGAPERQRWAADLDARFAAARLRGDSVHEKEESRFALAIHGDARRALALASENYAVQKEPADARVLLEAAIAAQAPGAAAPVLQWMASSGVESAVLRRLADRLRGRP